MEEVANHFKIIGDEVKVFVKAFKVVQNKRNIRWFYKKENLIATSVLKSWKLRTLVNLK